MLNVRAVRIYIYRLEGGGGRGEFPRVNREGGKNSYGQGSMAKFFFFLVGAK
jgi:hypothetical protein